jgi:hypothetical protein
MNTKKEISAIEFTLREIFRKEHINRFDVVIANRLFEKWKKLTNYKVEDANIIDKEPNYNNLK